MSPRTVALILAALVAVPAVATLVGAHTTGVPSSTLGSGAAPGSTPETLPPSAGYTGPGSVPYINFFQGIWVYGQVSATPLGNQFPLDIHGAGDWLVWQDANRGDIFAYDIPAGSGQYLGTDSGLQRSPAISDDVVVWEDYRSAQHTNVYAYFLGTGETRLLSSGPGNHLKPSIDGDIVAWEDTRSGNSDIWGYNISNHTEFPIFVGPDKETDPLVHGNTVYFRTYRFNTWDIMAVDLANGQPRQVTRDIAINGAPFTNGPDVLFLTQTQTAWRLDRYDAANDTVVPTALRFGDTTTTPVSGDHLIRAVLQQTYRQLVAENMTTGTATHVSGDMTVTSIPFFEGNTVYAPVMTRNGTDLLAIQVSPFAFSSRPSLTLNNPGNGVPWLATIQANGDLVGSGGFAQPSTFTYRVDDGAPQAIPTTSPHFVFALDPTGVAPGRHTLTLRATYRDGPPLEKDVSLFVPNPADTIDLVQAGHAYHAAAVASAVNTWFVKNPGSYFVLLLVLILIVLLVIRLWYWLKPKRRRVTIEYVPMDE